MKKKYEVYQDGKDSYAVGKVFDGMNGTNARYIGTNKETAQQICDIYNEHPVWDISQMMKELRHRFYAGQHVKIDADVKDWGRVTGEAEVLWFAQHGRRSRRLLVYSFAHRASMFVLKSECGPVTVPEEFPAATA